MNKNKPTNKKNHTPWSSDICSKDTRIVQNSQIIQCDTPNKQNEGKNHILKGHRKSVWQIQHPLTVKTLFYKVGIEGLHLNIIKAIWKVHS